jgi:hypothetical protein
MESGSAISACAIRADGQGQLRERHPSNCDRREQQGATASGFNSFANGTFATATGAYSDLLVID